MNDLKTKDSKEATKEAIVSKATVKDEVKTYYSTLILSIRRKNGLVGLPGEDPTNQNPKIGSSLKNRAPLSGLSHEEEKLYLPEIINVSPSDHTIWRKEIKDYWSNISEVVPHDDEAADPTLPGRKISFTVEFKTLQDKKAFDAAVTFEDKAEVSKRGIVVTGDTADYVLFRYCLVYGRVANSVKDVHNSPKIRFYLFSKEEKTKESYNKFKLEQQARTLFTSLLEKETSIDAILRLFGENPDNLTVFPSIEDKHLKLNEKISISPQTFIAYANDNKLAMKSFVKNCVSKGLIYIPPNTELHYLGSDKEVLLGRNLIQTVTFLETKDAKNIAIKDTLKSQLKATE